MLTVTRCSLKSQWNTISHLSEWLSSLNQQTNNKCWQGCREKRTLVHFWWESRLVQPLWKAVWRHLNKLKMDLPFDPEIPLLGMYLKKPKTLIWKNISTPMFIAALFTITKIMEAAQVSINRWVDKTTMGHLHNGILLGCKEEENFILCNSMDGRGEHYAEWNKPVRERQMPYDFTHMWNLMNKLN